MSDRLKRLTPLIGWAALALVLVGAAVAWLMLDPGFRAGRPEPAVAEMPQDEFEQRVRTYLLDNPGVIIEAMQNLEARRAAAEQTEAQAAVATWAGALFRDRASPVGGNPAGDVTLVEFFDYNCPYCRQVAPTMIEAEAADPQLRIVYKEFPILGPNSVFAAAAALAAHRQDRYVAFHQALMRVRGIVDEDAVLAAATELGLDVDRLKADMEDPEIQAAIERNLALAGALRINGTPGFVIGEEILRGATDLETLQGLIHRARAQQ
jgi:protein-disulfide isomerase